MFQIQAVNIIAHRGASYDAPENTLASVRLGWKQNADMVEVDIYLSKDNRIVVIHDKDLKRTTGTGGLVKEKTLAQLQSLDAGSWKSSDWKGEPIPALSQILHTIPKGKKLVIEIKCGPEIVGPLSRLLKSTKTRADQTAIISFSYEVVIAAKKEFPDRAVYFLKTLEQNASSGKWPQVDPLIDLATRAGIDGLNLGFKGSNKKGYVTKPSPSYLELLKEIRNKTRRHKMDFLTYTINDPGIARTLQKAGLDGITTDRPGYLRKALSR